jgi:integrase
MARTALTDRKVQSLKPAPKDKRYQVMDTVVRGFGVRVTDKGVRTYILQARFPGYKSPGRREIGRVGILTLEAAREKARAWTVLIKRGLDPAIVEAREREENALRRANTFASVCEDYIAVKLGTVRYGPEVEKRMRKYLIPPFKETPITEITDIAIISKVVTPRLRKTPSMARKLLNDVKTFLTWTVDQRVYGLKISPAVSVKTARVVGPIKPRQRVLTNVELRALWIAANRTPYPVGPLYRTLILTALRLKEAGETSRPEWDLQAGVWTIPAERMKGKLPHAVPITDELREIAGFFPNRGSFLFSYESGRKAISFGHAKNRIDVEMLKVLREIAVESGEDPETVELAHWTNHDIRRTVRTRLSRLKVLGDAREALLAHVKPGIERVYDVHDYFDEKREALEVWAAELRRIAEPTPDNVVPMRRERA